MNTMSARRRLFGQIPGRWDPYVAVTWALVFVFLAVFWAGMIRLAVEVLS